MYGRRICHRQEFLPRLNNINTDKKEYKVEQGFYTFREYMNRIGKTLTASMQDYLEMIYRLSREKGYTRIAQLSNALNVQPPAATRMVQKLAIMKLIKYQKYGILELEDSGKLLGESLIERHNIVEKFLKVLGVGEDMLLEETEKTEHMLSSETLHCVSVFIGFFECNQYFAAEYENFKKENIAGRLER